MSLKAYLLSWLTQLCRYNSSMEWLCDALEISPRPKQISCETLDLLKRAAGCTQMNNTATTPINEVVRRKFLEVIVGVPLPTTRVCIHLGLLLGWYLFFHWYINNGNRLRTYLRRRGWTLFLDDLFPAAIFDTAAQRGEQQEARERAQKQAREQQQQQQQGRRRRRQQRIAELDETSDYASLDDSAESSSSFFTTGGFDESIAHLVTVNEVQDFPGLFAQLEVVTCEKIAANTYFLRCERAKLGLTLIEASENSSLNLTFLEDLAFFRRVSASGADFANEAHGLDVKQIVAVYDSREYLNSLQLIDQSFEARRYFAVVYQYEECVPFRKFCTVHPTLDELMLIVEDMTTSLRSLQSAAAMCNAKMPAELLISLVSCRHDSYELDDRSLTCLNALGVSVRLNPLCLGIGVPLEKMFVSIDALRRQLQSESASSHSTIDHLVKTRAVRTCSALISLLAKLLKFDENSDVDVATVGRTCPVEREFYELFESMESFHTA